MARPAGMSRTSWLWIVLLELFDILAFEVPGAQASEYCSSYRDVYGYYHSGFTCTYYCCGSSRNKYCCTDSSQSVFYYKHTNVGAIVGGALTMFIVFGIVAMIICCCVSACPLYRSQYRGRVVGWWRGPAVATTTVHHTGATVVATTNAQMQPGIYGHRQPPPYRQPPPQQVAGPMGAPYGQHGAPYPQPAAYPYSSPPYPGPPQQGPLPPPPAYGFSPSVAPPAPMATTTTTHMSC